MPFGHLISMPVAPAPLPDLSTLDAAALRTLVVEQHAKLLSRETEIERLKLLILKLRRMQFGRKSEKLDKQIAQLELQLEDLEATQTESVAAPSAEAGVAPASRPCVWNVGGSAGGVRIAVAEGMGVSVGRDATAVPVCAAKTVAKACVLTAFESAVGLGFAPPEQEASNTAIRLRARMVRLGCKNMSGIVPKCRGGVTPPLHNHYSFDSPLMNASTFARQTSSRNCLGGVLKK